MLWLSLCALVASTASVAWTTILNDPLYTNPRHEFVKTIKQPYVFGADNSTLPFYNVHGDAQIVSNAIRLTPKASGKSGAVWSKTPSNLKEWAAVMAVHIKGDSVELGSDGLSFWYVEDPGKMGPIFGSKDRWNGLGVFFDSHDNDKKKDNPAILAVYNSANYDYPFDQDGMHHTFAHCFREYRNTFMPFLIKLIYQNKTLTVEVDSEGHGFDFVKCFSYSPIFLHPGFYFGVTAATGDFPDQHDLISLDIYELNAKLDTSAAKEFPFAKKLDERTSKSHQEFQDRLRDLARKKDAEDYRASGTDMKFIEKMVRNIEETQMELLDKVDEMLMRPGSGGAAGSGHDASSDGRMANMERQIMAMSNTLGSMSDTLMQLSGHQSGSKSLMDQVAQLNQIAHNKLAILEDVSKKSHDKAQELHMAFQEKESSSFWWYLCLIALQVVIVLWLALNWKKSDRSSGDKKFI